MLYYEVYDNQSDNWVVFLHGFGGSTRTWKRQLDAFPDYNLLLIDLPGHGNSSKEDFVSVTQVNYSIREVLDHLNIKKADFVALSLGTLVVSNFAVENPSYVNSIIFGGASLKLYGIYRFLMGFVYATKNIIPSRILFITMSKVLLPHKNHQKSREIFVRESLKMNRKNIILWVKYVSKMINAKNLIKGVQNLDIETLFISGSEDICFVRGAKDVVTDMANANLTIIENCGHVCSIERYREFNKAALNFLNRIHGKSAAFVEEAI